MMVCLGIQGKKNRLLRVGIYLFTIMEWVSAVGFSIFPLSDSGYAGTFQDKMHIFLTVIVVLLSIVSLVLIIIAGAKDKSCRSYGIFAAIALGMMMVGAVGMNIVPKDYFGIVERFSVFAATGYNAVLGIELYRMLHNTDMTYLKGLGVKDSTLWDLSGGDRSDESNSNG